MRVKMVQSLWEIMCQVLLKLDICIVYTIISTIWYLPNMPPKNANIWTSKYTHKKFHNSLSHNSLKLETTQMPIKSKINCEMAK